MHPPNQSDPSNASGDTHNARFTTTHWSVVLRAGQPTEPGSTDALERLCRAYWYPLYAYLRRRGQSPADAQDLTQQFFTRLLQKNLPAQADPTKGKFRSFLLLTLNHFLADERERAAALKRGNGEILLSLDADAPEERYHLEPVDNKTPEKLFQKKWAQTILEGAVSRLREEYTAAGKEDAYAVLQAFEPGEQKSLSYFEAASRLNVNETAFKSMVHRLRKRHRELVREVIAETVSSASEIDEELRYLIRIVGE